MSHVSSQNWIQSHMLSEEFIQKRNYVYQFESIQNGVSENQVQSSHLILEMTTSWSVRGERG